MLWIWIESRYRKVVPRRGDKPRMVNKTPRRLSALRIEYAWDTERRDTLLKIIRKRKLRWSTLDS